MIVELILEQRIAPQAFNHNFCTMKALLSIFTLMFLLLNIHQQRCQKLAKNCGCQSSSKGRAHFVSCG